jgi:phosphotransferase system HPr-like phosphotransfer protein
MVRSSLANDRRKDAREREVGSTTMSSSKTTVPNVVTGDVTIRSERGLNPLLARHVRDALQAYGCTATIHNGKGVAADARNLLELLLLGARAGERLTVRCVGPDAHAAHEALVVALASQGDPR